MCIMKELEDYTKAIYEAEGSVSFCGTSGVSDFITVTAKTAWWFLWYLSDKSIIMKIFKGEMLLRP